MIFIFFFKATVYVRAFWYLNQIEPRNQKYFWNSWLNKIQKQHVTAEYFGIMGAILSALFITVDLIQLNAFYYCVVCNPSAYLCSLCNKRYAVGNIKEREYLFRVHKISECPTRGAIVFCCKCDFHRTLIKLHGISYDGVELIVL